METPSSPWLADQSGHMSTSSVTMPSMGFVADDDALRHEGWARSRSSRTAGATPLPPAVTRISFLVARDVEVAVLVEVTDVAGVWNQPSTMESAVAVVVVVAGEDPDALEQNLAVLGDPDPEPGSGGGRPCRS